MFGSTVFLWLCRQRIHHDWLEKLGLQSGKGQGICCILMDSIPVSDYITKFEFWCITLIGVTAKIERRWAETNFDGAVLKLNSLDNSKKSPISVSWYLIAETNLLDS